MENVKVGDYLEVSCGKYKCQVVASIMVGKNLTYITNDCDNDYVRIFNSTQNITSFTPWVEPKEEIEELTVSEISQRLGKTIKVVE